MGAVDPRQGVDAHHAALVHRPQRGRPGLQVRPLAEPGADRHHRGLGRRRRPARQPRGPAPAAAVRRPRHVAHRRARLGRADSRAVPGAGRGRQLVGRPVLAVRADRGRVDQGGRDQAVGRGLPGGAPRGDAPAGARGRRGGRLPERVRPGQERRHLPAGHRPPRQGELDHPVQHALRVDRARRHRPHERRTAVLSEGRGAREGAVLARPGPELRPRHSAGRGQRAARQLPPVHQQRAADRVPAPPAQPRKAAVHRGDPARREHRDHQLRHLGLRLAHRLQLRRRRAAAAAGGLVPAHDHVARQLGRQPVEPRRG